MVDLDTARNLCMDTWFGDEHADQVVLNGSAINAQVLEQSAESSEEAMADYLDIEFRAADYPTVAYRTDKVIANGNTWSYPKLIREDNYTKLVRFRRNVRPRV